jgi:hypothetical protein
MELTQGRKKLVETQPSLGVRAGCQLFERFVGASGAGEVRPLVLIVLSADPSLRISHRTDDHWSSKAECSALSPRQNVVTRLRNWLLVSCEMTL